LIELLVKLRKRPAKAHRSTSILVYSFPFSPRECKRGRDTFLRNCKVVGKATASSLCLAFTENYLHISCFRTSFSISFDRLHSHIIFLVIRVIILFSCA